MLTSNKRPIETEGFIDLTLSDDEEISRPTKRARSGSFRSTPPEPNALLTSSATTRNKSPQKFDKRDNRDGSTFSKLNGLSKNTISRVNSSPHHYEQSFNAVRSRIGSGQALPVPTIQPSATLANGLNRLSFRSSPARKLPGKEVRPVVILDLDTESEKDTSKTKQRKPIYSAKHPSPGPLATDLSLSDWIKSDVKPIRFNPNAEFHDSAPERAKAQASITPNLFKNLPLVTRNSGVLSKPQRLSGTSQIPKVPSVIVPPTEAQVLRRIKDDITYIRTNPKEVEDGIGVARFDDTDINTTAFKRATQKRRKASVKRELLSLDLGEPAISKIVEDKSVTEPRRAVRHVLLERFKQIHDAPLTFKNLIDERCLDGKFQFVSGYIRSRGVLKRKQTPLPYRTCRCGPTDPCQGVCNCAIIQAKEPGGDLREVKGIRPYERNARGTVVLSRTLLDLTSKETPVIYECTNSCSCGNLCTNKVVQKGRTSALRIFETGRCGFGVRAMQDIAKGQFIDMYLGEVLTTSEIQKREKAAEEDTPSYIMSLDMFIAEEKTNFHVDGANFGSVMRFVNHSCEPNAKTFAVVLSGDTKHIYHVAFFAIKDIGKGSEVTIDYDPDFKEQLIDEAQLGDETLDAAIVQCKCGTTNCRKRLWMPGKEKRVKRRYLPDVDDD